MFDRGMLLDWNNRSREQVRQEAESRGLPLRELACTLMTAVVGGTCAVFTQIGDGAIVFDLGDSYAFAFWPDRGEYANATRFLTDGDWQEHVRFDRVDRTLLDLAMLTDGLQMLALNFEDGRVHDRFFRPMFGHLCQERRTDFLQSSLLGFLDSKRVNARTDDDKTLLLATRRTVSDHVQVGINSQAD